MPLLLSNPRCPKPPVLPFWAEFTYFLDVKMVNFIVKSAPLLLATRVFDYPENSWGTVFRRGRSSRSKENTFRAVGVSADESARFHLK